MPPLVAILALAALQSQTRWKPVDGPTVGPIASLAISPPGHGGIVASVGTFAPYPIFPGAEFSWSRRGEDWFSRWSKDAFQLVDIQWDPVRAGVLWASNYDAMLKSLDGGLTWTTAWNPGSPIESIAVDRADPDRVYGIGNPSEADGELHRTLDGGRTWVDLFHFDFSNSVVAVVNDVVPSAVLCAGGSGIRRSTDLGETFAPVLSVPLATKLAVAEERPSVVWCLAGDVHIVSDVYRSLDGGRSFARRAAPGGDLSAIAAHPTDPEKACVATIASGVFSTSDGGRSWVRAADIPDTARLETIRVDPGEPSHLFAGGTGSQGGVWFSADFGLHWQPSARGPGSAVPRLLFDRDGRAYAAGLRTPVRRSAPGSTWEVLDHPQGSTTFVGALAVDPTRPSTIAWFDDRPSWELANPVWASSDDGRTWQDVTPPAAHFPQFKVKALGFDREGTLWALSLHGQFFRRTAGSSVWSNHAGTWSTPSGFVPDPHDAAVIHVTELGRYFRSTDGGRNWTSDATGLADAWSLDGLSVNPADTDELFVLAYESAGHRRLFRSRDRGASFRTVGSGLPQDYLACLALDPDVDGRLLVGTRGGGVFLSEDHGATFVPRNEGLAEAPIFSIAFDPTRTSVALLSQADGGLFERALP